MGFDTAPEISLSIRLGCGWSGLYRYIYGGSFRIILKPTTNSHNVRLWAMSRILFYLVTYIIDAQKTYTLGCGFSSVRTLYICRFLLWNDWRYLHIAKGFLYGMASHKPCVDVASLRLLRNRIRETMFEYVLKSLRSFSWLSLWELEHGPWMLFRFLGVICSQIL